MTVAAQETTLPLNLWERLCKRIRIGMLYIAGITLMTTGSLLTLIVATITLFQFRRLYAEVMIGTMAKIGLWMMGVRFVVHQDGSFPDRQAVYISNHASTLDIFILTALRLPNARFFLSGSLRQRIPPLGLLGYLARVFWTVPQSLPEQRVKIFKRAEQALRRTGESVYLSPEGTIGEMGIIAPFNKGAFHLATNLHAPIVPIFIDIPREIDPGWGYDFKPGVVDVHIMPTISTEQWTVERLDQNRNLMHDYYLELQERYQGQQ